MVVVVVAAAAAGAGAGAGAGAVVVVVVAAVTIILIMIIIIVLMIIGGRHAASRGESPPGWPHSGRRTTVTRDRLRRTLGWRLAFVPPSLLRSRIC